MGKEMLKLLEVPKSVTDNLETIDTIEKALHKVGYFFFIKEAEKKFLH